MERDSQIGVASFRKLKQKNSGYVLLFLMLIIGSLSLYLSYQLSLKKINTQAWQVTKTATEFSYWFDIEKNYETDFSVATPTALNIITMNTLISTQRYLPYGLARAPGIPSSGTPAVTAVSEFQCSSLPGITKADELSDSGVSGSTDYTCPANASSTTNCKLGQPAYYSCAPSATAPSNSSAPTTAQYYINANHIALGATSNNAPIGLGLIVRTSGPASANISLTGGGTRGSLPNGSFAQSLVSSLPSASYNVYSTINSNVQGIGIGSYLITST
ncbi:MAG: hypothetical protein K0R48_136, partial [Gammaproteobacteria bacterium]|nr:hypothetical protein [Gammaproteobacteria bacterium]